MLKFQVREFNGQALVSYKCDCDCKPSARYAPANAEAGHEHCCCGKVHFAGQGAMEQMQEYLANRR